MFGDLRVYSSGTITVVLSEGLSLLCFCYYCFSELIGTWKGHAEINANKFSTLYLILSN